MAEAASNIAVASDTVLHASVRQVLRNANFRKLWFSQVFSQIAGHTINFILVIKIFQMTGSNFLVSVLIALVSIPPVLFSSLAGVYADTFNRKYILIASNLARSIVVILIAMFDTSPAMMLAFAFVISSISQFFGPAESSTIPSLVERNEYYSANSLFVFTTYTSFLVGYSLAGPALHYLGEIRTSALLVVSFTISAIWNILLPAMTDHLIHQRGRSYLDRAFGNIRGDFLEGVRFIRESRIIFLVVALVSLVFAIERAVIGLLPDLAQNILHYSIDEISYFLIAPAGIGAFLGVLFGNTIKRRVNKLAMIISGLAIDGIVLVALPLYPWFDRITEGRGDLIVLIALGAFLSGVADVLVIVAAQTLIHEHTPANTRGRVFGSLITLMNFLGLPLILAVGWLTKTFAITHLFVALGVLLLAFYAWGVAYRRRWIHSESPGGAPETP